MADYRVVVSLSLAMVCTSAAQAAEIVKFPGAGVTLTAILYRPPGPGPFPAVIALHGCGGLYGGNGALSPRHADWAERLVAQNFIVLFPDSFGSRGAKSQCRTRERVTRPSRERVADALAAKSYLQSRADVKIESVSLLGWSNGASTVLHAVDKSRRPADVKPDFRKAIAFYPGCRTLVEQGNWRARMPLLILIGAADDWTPAAPCRALAEKAAATGQPVSVKIYPGAYHDFDHPNLPLRLHTGLAYTADGSGRAHTGTDQAARQDALGRVPDFLRQ